MTPCSRGASCRRASSYSDPAKTMWEGRAANFSRGGRTSEFYEPSPDLGMLAINSKFKNIEQAKQSSLVGQIWPSSYQVATSAQKLGH